MVGRRCHMAKNILEMKGICKSFGPVKALSNVNLVVQEGEIHAICGENGAGKSTLMNVLSGIYPHGTYEGDIVYEGELCKFKTIKDSESKGIVIIHQELALIPYFTIAENMFLGNERGTKFNIDWSETDKRAGQELEVVGLADSPTTLIKDIGVGKQQLVEIAKALAKNVKLLILDEPTASLNENDSKNLLELMLKLKREGITSIIISHKLHEIAYVADKITIVRDGSTIETIDKRVDAFTEDRIVKGMVGRDLTDRYPKRVVNTISDEVMFEVKNWNAYHPLYHERKLVDNVSINVKKGEVVGISGLMGAGRTELAMSVFGKSYGTAISGTVKIGGREVVLNTVKEAIDAKLAYVTEDRKGNGMVLTEPIVINTTMAKMDKVSSKHGVIDKNKEYVVAEDYRAKLKTKCASVDQLVGKLSGGNQQKVLLAKWMFADPDVLILDEPTRGIDVGAKYEIYCIVNQLVSEGKCVLVISSDMAELLGISDRIYVMNEGRMVGELSAAEASQEKIMSLILQSGKQSSASGKEEVA